MIKRFGLIDSYRGFAIILMTVYHFCFDLNYFGVIHQNMNYDSFWLNFRALIMSSFVGIAGWSAAFAADQISKKNYRKRNLQLFVCSLLISICTYFLNSRTWVFFGVLHFLFFCSILSPYLIQILKKQGYLILSAGIVLTVLPNFFRNNFFNQSLLILSGLSPAKPITEDFSPLMPWLGVYLIGLFLGQYSKLQKEISFFKKEISFLSFLGKHSLFYYMTHQLILYPVAYFISKL